MSATIKGFVDSVAAIDTGGGCEALRINLADGRIVILTHELIGEGTLEVGVYDSEEAWENGDCSAPEVFAGGDNVVVFAHSDKPLEEERFTAS